MIGTDIADAFHVRYCHGLPPLPGITEDMAEEVYYAANWDWWFRMNQTEWLRLRYCIHINHAIMVLNFASVLDLFLVNYYRILTTRLQTTYSTSSCCSLRMTLHWGLLWYDLSFVASHQSSQSFTVFTRCLCRKLAIICRALGT